MSGNDNSGGFFAGFVFGAFVGAALALLFSPGPGDEIREQLREKSIELKERAGDLDIDELKSKGHHLLDEQRSRFQEAIEEGKKAASLRKEELLDQLEAGASDDSIELSEQDA